MGDICHLYLMDITHIREVVFILLMTNFIIFFLYIFAILNVTKKNQLSNSFQFNLFRTKQKIIKNIPDFSQQNPQTH